MVMNVNNNVLNTAMQPAKIKMVPVFVKQVTQGKSVIRVIKCKNY